MLFPFFCAFVLLWFLLSSLRECFSRPFLRIDLGNCYLYPGINPEASKCPSIDPTHVPLFGLCALFAFLFNAFPCASTLGIFVILGFVIWNLIFLSIFLCLRASVVIFSIVAGVNTIPINIPLDESRGFKTPGHRTLLLAYAFPILLCFRAFVVPVVVLRECFSRSFLRIDFGILEFVILNLIIIHCPLSIVNWFLSFVFSPIFDNILRIILKGHGSDHG